MTDSYGGLSVTTAAEGRIRGTSSGNCCCQAVGDRSRETTEGNVYVSEEQQEDGQPVQEDLAKCHLAGYQPSLPGRCTLFFAELQRTMRSDEVIMALQERHLIFEVLGKARMPRAPAAQVRAALANRQVQSLDEACVHPRGILGLE